MGDAADAVEPVEEPPLLPQQGLSDPPDGLPSADNDRLLRRRSFCATFGESPRSLGEEAAIVTAAVANDSGLAPDYDRQLRRKSFSATFGTAPLAKPEDIPETVPHTGLAHEDHQRLRRRSFCATFGTEEKASSREEVADPTPHFYGEAPSTLSPSGVTAWHSPHKARKPHAPRVTGEFPTLRPALPAVFVRHSASESQESPVGTSVGTSISGSFRDNSSFGRNLRANATRVDGGICRSHHSAFLHGQAPKAPLDAVRLSPGKLPAVFQPARERALPKHKEVSFTAPWAGWRAKHPLQKTWWSSLVESSPFGQPMPSPREDKHRQAKSPRKVNQRHDSPRVLGPRSRRMLAEMADGDRLMQEDTESGESMSLPSSEDVFPETARMDI